MNPMRCEQLILIVPIYHINITIPNAAAKIEREMPINNYQGVKNMLVLIIFLSMQEKMIHTVMRNKDF